MKRKYFVVWIVVLSFFIVGGTATATVPEAVLDIIGNGIEISLTAEQMLGRNQDTFRCENIDSSGNISEVVITGFSLNHLLAEHGIDIAKVASINFVAADGYVMAAPAEVYAEVPVYIMLKRDGQDLDYPRSCIPNQRSMYWVKNLAKIVLVSDESLALQEEIKVQKTSFFREAINSLEAVPQYNRGHQAASYSLRTYFEQFANAVPEFPVTMMALDGFEKTETAEVFLANFVTLDPGPGQEADLPLYFSEEISLGMRVKQLNIVISAADAVYFGSQISVAELFRLVDMDQAESYHFIASDGYVTEIPAAAIPFGTIYPDEKKGYTRAQFEGYDFAGAAGDGKVKYLLAIEASNLVAAWPRPPENAHSETLLTFEGAKVEQMTWEEFLALEQITVTLTRKNSKGKTTTGTYTGVHWKVLARAIGAEDAKSVKAIASDGFEQAYPLDLLEDPNSLFALYKDGEFVTEEEANGQIWFCGSEAYTANYWTKFIAKIVVK